MTAQVKDYRVVLIILDSVGVGELPDADKYGDRGSNTLAHIADAVGGLKLPNLARLGLGNILPLKGLPPAGYPTACFGKMSEKSYGKDTTTGHWELAGIVTKKAFPTYPNGFPKDLIDKFQDAIGTKIIGNKTASGTAIIDELGKEHIDTGYPIVYTSADSVFQIAAHEDIIPPEKLYRICETARSLLVYPHNVSRVIARPFIGSPGKFKRTTRRRDFSLNPPHATLLDHINNTLGIGKIWDIFAGQGITEYIHTKNNLEGIQKTIHAVKNNRDRKLIFTNLVDFDMLYGHRNDANGYYRSLLEFDNYVPGILKHLGKKDILIITADHGCDPTTKSTDHSREYVPLLVYGTGITPGVNLGTRKSFCDIGQTLSELWGLPKLKYGTSFLKKIL